MIKYFTLEEAQNILKYVKKSIKRILELKTSLDVVNSINIEYTDEYTGDFNELNFTKINKEFHRLSYEFFTSIEDLENHGCVIKDLNEGLVDFYSVHKGKEILLCWKYGEDKIEYWHDIECGFEGRQPIENLVKAKF